MPPAYAISLHLKLNNPDVAQGVMNALPFNYESGVREREYESTRITDDATGLTHIVAHIPMNAEEDARSVFSEVKQLTGLAMAAEDGSYANLHECPQGGGPASDEVWSCRDRILDELAL